MNGAGFRHGAFPDAHGRTRFSVWAPSARHVEVVTGGAVAGPLRRSEDGYHAGLLDAPPGTRYRYLLDGRGPFADPASRSQPDGVHGASAVVDCRGAPPVEGWHGLPLAAHVICEVHVGTFSAAGTFDGVTASLGELAHAGYSAIELMPVAEFPGTRNWGYDGVFPFAVHHAYGGRDGLARLCAAAHRLGVAVVLDVVYNHFGPEGAVFSEYGPYLTDRYRTPWGEAVNLDGPGSDEVRRFFVEHAVSCARELGVDGFRLDAVHELADRTAAPFVGELAAALHAEGRRAGRTITVVAESPDNDARLVRPVEASGLGLDGVWNDDFHHALRASLTGQRDRFFGDYRGVDDLAVACTAGFVVAGRVAPSRGRRHGARPWPPLAGERLVVFAQNHDQIGNGGFGERLAASLPLDAQFPITAAVLLSGWVPLRFMGEEYGETAPFHYFVDHGDPSLLDAVREGRRAEVGALAGAAHDELPDPGDASTFAVCRPDRSRATHGVHRELLEWQRRLLELRREEPALGTLEPARTWAWTPATGAAWVLVRRADAALGARPVVVAGNLHDGPAVVHPPLAMAGCSGRLEVLAARDAGVEEPAARTGSGPGTGGPALQLGPYGVVVAAVADLT
jgi:maltooligosyltrehalose trehalohydrolase